jgi:hypothetical protein
LKQITHGDNALIRRNLKKVDETVLLLADVTTLSAEISQNGSVIETLTYPHAKLRQGATTSQVELEVSTDVSAKFGKGKVTVKWTIVVASAIFTSEGSQKSTKYENILDVK